MNLEDLRFYTDYYSERITIHYLQINISIKKSVMSIAFFVQIMHNGDMVQDAIRATPEFIQGGVLYGKARTVYLRQF